MSGTITPCLWFDRDAEAAAQYYVSVFPNSSIGEISRYGEGAPLPAGTALTVSFTLNGRAFMGLNGGPYFTFNEAVSFVIDCADQAEADYYWETLVTGGSPSQCGWLKDRYGVSWQIVPRELPSLLQSQDRAAAARAMQAMLKMSKIDIATIRRAYDHP